MEETTEATPLPDDVVREILLRVPTEDVAALFRCAVTCKQWRAVVADLSFLRQHWPEKAPHPSSGLGFFDSPYGNQGPLFISPEKVLGARRRSLGSFLVAATPPGILNRAVPLATRGGLLVVRLAGDSLRLAVCDIIKGTCDVLPPLECTVSWCGCAILTREDCCSLDGQQGQYSAFFKVLAMVASNNAQDCNLYIFSSSEPNWSEPRKCFRDAWQRNTADLRILMGTNRAVVCRGVAYWLGSYSTYPWSLPNYFTYGVNVETGQISLTKLSILANQLASRSFGEMLSVNAHGNISLFQFEKEGLRLNTWTRGDNGTWLRTRAIELKPPKQAWDPGYVSMLPGEKSGTLFMTDACGYVYKTDPDKGPMEDVTAELGGLCSGAVPIEIDWPALFMSRLAV
ncbi:hypothetical protein QYE76_026547 [Lolium multiflorum]|uniref:F-box domain-containing protein n=1 Tax=Lolium multiflorum TaxID=4521 RepID=A0AAD8RGF4_LOLMU|nr:hypothetical protein QYE76_026547 [Lolium multiflorum]